MVLIITGMHRSGTSLTASLFQQLGIDFGTALVPADRHNPKGYFEDIDFLEFQRHVLQKCCDPNDPGWHDWGWTVNETLNSQLFDRYKSQAQELLHRRNHIKNLWGWKDPRTSLMLDFWHDLIPDSYFLLVFRYPWDVVDSIKRLNAPIFTDHPEFILPIWRYYNQKLISFYQKYPHRCVLFCTNYPDRFRDLINYCGQKFNIPFAGKNPTEITQKIYDRSLFQQLPRITQAVDDQTQSLLQQLEQIANIEGNHC